MDFKALILDTHIFSLLCYKKLVLGHPVKPQGHSRERLRFHFVQKNISLVE